MSTPAGLNEDIARTVADFMATLTQAKAETVMSSFARLAESHVAENALVVGDIAPNFTLPGATGATVALYDLLNRGPVVLSFYRGGWCPFCSLELRALQSILDDIHAREAQLVADSPEQPDSSLSTKEKFGLDFDVLSDKGNKVAQSYGLISPVYKEMHALYLEWGFDLPAINGDDSWELPVPATYIIDRDSVIRAAGIDKDYTRRMEPDAVLAALADL